MGVFPLGERFPVVANDGQNFGFGQLVPKLRHPVAAVCYLGDLVLNLWVFCGNTTE